jgi:hypothetical protein
MSTGILTPPEPIDRVPVAEASSLAQASRRYLADCGWHTHIVGPMLLLTLRRGLVGVLIGPARGKAVEQELRGQGLVYPVLPGFRARPTWVFIARNGPYDYRLRSHFFAVILRNVRIPLPPSKIEGKPLEWIVAPDSCPGIPELGPLMSVIRDSDDRPVRAWQPKSWHPRGSADSGHLL